VSAWEVRKRAGELRELGELRGLGSWGAGGAVLADFQVVLLVGIRGS